MKRAPTTDRDVLVAALLKALESGDELDLAGGSRNARPLDIDHPGPSFRNRWFAASYRWMVDSNAARAALAVEPAEGLDAAWAEAEAALPTAGSRRITGLQWPTDNDDQWLATAEGAYQTTQGTGPTPAAALRALAAKLRETP